MFLGRHDLNNQHSTEIFNGYPHEISCFGFWIYLKDEWRFRIMLPLHFHLVCIVIYSCCWGRVSGRLFDFNKYIFCIHHTSARSIVIF